MAQATVNSVAVGTQIVTNGATLCNNAQLFGGTYGLYPFETTFALPSGYSDDVGDEFFVLTFPSQCRLYGLRYTANGSGVDSGTTLVENVIAENASGTEVTLISGTTVGRAGGSISLDNAMIGVDVSDMKLGVKTTTGSTGITASQTITFVGLICIGPANYAFISVT